MDIPQYPAFVPLDLEHKDILTGFLKADPPLTSELTFTNLYIWRSLYGIKLARFEQGILLLAEPEDAAPFFFQPVGFDAPLPPALACLDYLDQRGSSAGLRRVAKPVANALVQADGGLTAIPDPDNHDYVYKVDDLINLAGRKYHRKKNHLNKFSKLYESEYRALTPDLKDDCLKIVEDWCVLRQCEESPRLIGEEKAIREALDHLDDLACIGGAIRVDGRVEAFTIGEPLNENTVVIHIEKANADIQGIYGAINQQFLEREWSGFELVNREQDCGEEGLRKAKESYLPDHMVEKFIVRKAP